MVNAQENAQTHQYARFIPTRRWRGPPGMHGRRARHTAETLLSFVASAPDEIDSEPISMGRLCRADARSTRVAIQMFQRIATRDWYTHREATRSFTIYDANMGDIHATIRFVLRQISEAAQRGQDIIHLTLAVPKEYDGARYVHTHQNGVRNDPEEHAHA